MPAKPSVAIYGGGVGGLSAAHELAEREKARVQAFLEIAENASS